MSYIWIFTRWHCRSSACASSTVAILNIVRVVGHNHHNQIAMSAHNTSKLVQTELSCDRSTLFSVFSVFTCISTMWYMHLLNTLGKNPNSCLQRVGTNCEQLVDRVSYRYCTNSLRIRQNMTCVQLVTGDKFDVVMMGGVLESWWVCARIPMHASTLSACNRNVLHTRCTGATSFTTLGTSWYICLLHSETIKQFRDKSRRLPCWLILITHIHSHIDCCMYVACQCM